MTLDSREVLEHGFDNGLCPDDCQYLKKDFETYPMGEREVRETTVECDLLNGPRVYCVNCPMYDEWTKELSDDH